MAPHQSATAMTDAAPPIAAETAATGDRRRLMIDLASSYALSVARVSSNAIIIGFLYRHTTPSWVAVYVLMRSMLVLANYMLAGLGPATLRELTRDDRGAASFATTAPALAMPAGAALDYAAPTVPDPLAPNVPPSRRFNALVVSALFGVILTAAAMLYAAMFPTIHSTGVPSGEPTWFFNGVALFALGAILRGSSDAAGAAVQWRGRLWLDNAIVVAGEVGFVLLALANADPKFGRTFVGIGQAYAVTGSLVALARWAAAGLGTGGEAGACRGDAQIIRRLCGTALLVSVGSFADFLYGPANVLLIDRTLGAPTLAAYAPALQIDSALLLTISAIAPVVTPRIAIAIAQGDRAGVRRMYVTATVAGLVVLLLCAIAVLSVRGTLLRLWLGEIPPVTDEILPLVLIHTVVGGTAGVGRAVLLAMGRFRAYTVSAVIGGVANVALALLFVVGFGWGLRGVALATIVAVVARCAIWMPWYVLRATR